MRLEICHDTHYTYSNPVTESVNEVRLSPRTNKMQSCRQHSIVTQPRASLFFYEDYFSNRVHAFTIQTPHRELTIRMKSIVVTSDPTPNHLNHTLNAFDQWLYTRTDDFQNRFAEYLLPTHYTAITPALMDFADNLAPAPRVVERIHPGHTHSSKREIDVVEWSRQLTRTIYSNFAYSPNVTTVQTTSDQMLQLRSGVCQDFAHLMISVCRLRGIPARYVSGYHFVGDLRMSDTNFEQASHAWVELYAPGIGWISFDPTNDSEIGQRYVKLGHGRDYNDIVPVKGVYRGSGSQQLGVTVKVSVIED